MKTTNKNYTLTFIDEDLKRKFYFAGFTRVNGGRTATGCEVITKKYTKEEALKIKETYKKLHPWDRSIRLVKVGK